MAEVFGVISGAGGVISLTMQIGEIVARFCSDWKEAPKEVEEFRREIESLRVLLDATTGRLKDPAFQKTLEGRSSLLHDQLETEEGGKTTTRELFDECQQQLEKILGDLRDCQVEMDVDDEKGVPRAEKDVKGMTGRIRTKLKRKPRGWERVKMAISAPATREAIQKAHKRCDLLNSVVTLDAHQLATETRLVALGTHQIATETNAVALTTHQIASETRGVTVDTHQLATETRLVALATHQLAGAATKLGLGTYQLASETKLDVKTLVTQQLSRDDEDILKWLSQEEYGAQFSDFEKRCGEGTGQWFLDSNTFKRWKDGTSKVPTILCMGMPGAGKTMITTIVLRKLMEDLRAEPNTGLAYLYCNYKGHQSSDAAVLLRALLRQLAGQLLSGLPEEVKELYRAYKRYQTLPSLQQIREALTATVRHYARVFIVVDALDECPAPEGVRNKLISTIQALQLESNQRDKTKLSTLFTARQIPDIEEKFKESTKVEIRAKDEDIRRYIEGLVRNDELPRFVRSDADLREEAILRIIEAADGMFQLASLHVKALFGSISKAMLKCKLETLPRGDSSSGYDRAYESIMERIENSHQNCRESAMKALSWICYSKLPLSTGQLRHALAVSVGAKEIDLTDLPDLESIISNCCGLITETRPGGTIRMVHYTAQEFFDRNGARFLPDGNRLIAETCLTAFLSTFMINGREEMVGRKNSPSFEQWIWFRYARRYWHKHAREESRLDGSFRELVVKFFTDSRERVCRVLKKQCKLVFNFNSTCVEHGRLLNRRLIGLALCEKRRRVQLAAWFGLSDFVWLFLTEESLTATNWRSSSCSSPLSPLLFAVCGYGSDDLTIELLQKGFTDGEALALSAGYRKSVFQFLLFQKGAVFNIPDRSGRTALSYLVESGSLDLLKLLLKQGEPEPQPEASVPIQTRILTGDTSSRDFSTSTWYKPWSWLGSSAKTFGSSARTFGSPARTFDAEKVGLNSRTVVDEFPPEPSLDTNLVLRLLEIPPILYAIYLPRKLIENWNRNELDLELISRKCAIILTLLETDAVEHLNTMVRVSYNAVVLECFTPLVKYCHSIFPTKGQSEPVGYECVHSRKARCIHWISIMRRDSVMVSVDEITTFERLLEYTWRSESKSDPNVLLHWTTPSDHYSNISASPKRTPLSLAAEFGLEEMFVRLIDLGANAHGECKDDKRTPLSYAAEGGYQGIVNILLKSQGVKPNAKCGSRIGFGGRTPLSYAADCGHDSVVSMLLAVDGIEVDLPDNLGRTPLSYAAENGHNNVVKLLLRDNRIQPTSHDHLGMTPLSYAVAGLQISTVRLLLDTKLGDVANPFLSAMEGRKSAFVRLVTTKIENTTSEKFDNGRDYPGLLMHSCLEMCHDFEIREKEDILLRRDFCREFKLGARVDDESLQAIYGEGVRAAKPFVRIPDSRHTSWIPSFKRSHGSFRWLYAQLE